MKATLFLTLALAAVTVEPSRAHHSLVAGYLFNKSVTIEGTVAEFLLRSPHSFLRVDVTDASGRIETWLAESGSASQLGRAGIMKDSLRAGDRVLVTGNPSRDPAERKMHLTSVTRPADGWKWSVDTQ